MKMISETQKSFWCRKMSKKNNWSNLFLRVWYAWWRYISRTSWQSFHCKDWSIFTGFSEYKEYTYHHDIEAKVLADMHDWSWTVYDDVLEIHMDILQIHAFKLLLLFVSLFLNLDIYFFIIFIINWSGIYLIYFDRFIAVYLVLIKWWYQNHVYTSVIRVNASLINRLHILVNVTENWLNHRKTTWCLGPLVH